MTSSKNVSRLRLPLENDVTGGNPEFGLKSVRVSPPPLLSKTVLAGFLAHGSSVKRSLSLERRHQHIVRKLEHDYRVIYGLDRSGN
jgi:hypothetical protein